MAENRVIGRDNDLPWSLPDDMKHFMRTTLGKPVVMGRKTYTSMNGALPRRPNIVVTRDNAWTCSDAHVEHSLEDGLDRARDIARAEGGDEVMVIGGAEIYALALPSATRLYVTWVHGEIQGDVFFPEFDWSGWREVSRQDHAVDERHAMAFSVIQYER